MFSNGVLIVGYGVVGHNLAKELEKLKPDVYDKFKTECNTKKEGHTYSVAFICVDTPFISKENACDISAVFDALQENDADIYVIKSTVLPGTTEKFAKKLGKRIVFSPEYYGGTQHCNNYHFDFTILGGDKKDCLPLVQMLQKVYDGRHTFRVCDTKTAELAKYMENSWLATKVSFCGQFHKLAGQIGVSYEELRELFTLDPRVNPAHTFVYNDKPYWDSHCLNKDVPAIAYEHDATFLKSVIDFNQKQKEEALRSNQSGEV